MLRWLCSLLFLLTSTSLLHADTPRQVIAKTILTEDSEEQVKLINSLSAAANDDVLAQLNFWKEGGVFLYEADDGAKTPITLGEAKDAEGKQLAFRFDTGEPLKDKDGKQLALLASDLNDAAPDSALRSAIKQISDLYLLATPDLKKRLAAVEAISNQRDPAMLPALEARLPLEKHSKVKHGLEEAIALIQLQSEDDAVVIAACVKLGELDSIPSKDALKELYGKTKEPKPAVAEAARKAIKQIEEHITFVNGAGSMFRGLSTGSVLLVVAIGLAITFGLMGVINMAHGEMIAIGAYTTYLIQCIFGAGWEGSPFGISLKLPGMNATGSLYDCYFLVAIPASFIVAALVGVVLERGIIRFLYRRPLESLLATWGVSLVLQQLFRLTFGANNVQVASPSWLSGNWTVNDIIFGWNRLFVIGFAILIFYGLSLLLKKTPLGLLIRAVMQNRQMAACVGVRTERVNMLTFALGSGLAGLAGAFISQISNVGPGMGQLYIVESFMTVVVGGVGNLIGTVISALGIGVLDQSLQQFLGNPVKGKILVLAGIILFLQWKPAGLFVTKSRSLES